MRYISLLALFVGVFLACVAVEAVFRLSGSGLSLTDTRGIGQVSLFIVILPPIFAFAWFLSPEKPSVFFARYRAEWRRALRGFFAMYLQTTLLMIVAYAVLGALGHVSWSGEAWQKLSLLLVWKTFVAVLVVVVLATTEETIFRGFVLRHLRWNSTAAVTIGAALATSLIFSVSHLIAYKGPWTAWDVLGLLFGLFLLGLLFATTYMVTGSLACSIGVHVGLLGFKVILRRTHLLDYSPDAWWLGGSNDIRLAPLSWLVMILIGVGIWLSRRWLRREFYIEPAVGAVGPAPTRAA